MKRFIVSLIGSGWISLFVAPVYGFPLGRELLISACSTPTADLALRGTCPSQGCDATNTNLGFVVVWYSASSTGTDSSDSSVQGRQFDSDLTALTGEFQINSYTNNNQLNPSVASDASGNFVVVWQSDGSSGSDTSGYSILGQRFDSSAGFVGSEFQINSYTTSHQSYPAIASDSSGEFVVVWQSSGSSGTDDGLSIQGQRFDSLGTAVGGEFQINSYTTDYQSYPAIANDSSGEFVVVWHSQTSSGTDTSFESIQQRRFTSSGAPIGVDLQSNSYTTGSQSHPSVARDPNGAFVVVWESDGSPDDDTDMESIQGQRFDSSGTPSGAQLQINTITTGPQLLPSVAIGAKGRFIVVWSGDGIRGRWFTSTGSPLTEEFVVNSYTTGEPIEPRVAIDADSNSFAFYTHDRPPPNIPNIYARRVNLPFEIFDDGFESGDITCWSSTECSRRPPEGTVP